MRVSQKITSVFMSIVLTAGLCPGLAYAGNLMSTEVAGTDLTNSEESYPQDDGLGQEAVVVVGEEFTIDNLPSMGSPDELLTGYAQQRLDDELQSSAVSAGQLSNGSLGTLSLPEDNKLSEMQIQLLDILRGRVSSVASGKEPSTTFEISLGDLGIKETWTASELGVDSIIVDSAINSEAVSVVNAVLPTIDEVGAVVRALCVDAPFDMYWFDVKSGISYAPYKSLSANSSQLTLKGPMTINMSVASAYQGSEDLTVSNAQSERINAAIADAQSIVNANANRSALEKLTAYKKAICNRVVYNKAAAEDNTTPYGDPWQLISVFDGDNDTNVVCEGYSKAFQYLCDLAPISDVNCYTVSGVMSVEGQGGGNHMWNVVNMDDGRNYLVDVTNCDENSVGSPDKLFMAYGPSGNLNDGYTFQFESGNVDYAVLYKYADKTLSILNESALTISETGYSGALQLEEASDPSAIEGLVYNGQEQEGVSSGTGYTVTGGTATNAGTHTATAKLQPGYKWSDDSTVDKQVPFTIQPRSITNAAVANVSPQVYSGVDIEPAPIVTDTGLNGVTLSPGTDYTLSYGNNVNVGEAIITVTGQGNYSGTLSTTFQITPKSVTVTAQNATKIYGETDPALTATVEGEVAGNPVKYTLSRENDENVGSYPINVTLGENPNYDVTATPGTFTINKAASAGIGLVVNGYEGVYDASPHSASASAAVQGTTLRYSTDGGKTWVDEAPSLTNVGEIFFKVKAVNANYEDQVTEGALKVTRKPATVKADDKSKVYGEGDPDLTATVTGVLNNDPINYIVSRVQGEDVGEYAITPSGGAEQGNYAVIYEDGVFGITQSPDAQVGLRVTGYNGAYDGNAHGVTVNVNQSEGTEIVYKVGDGEWGPEAPTITNVGEVTVKVRAKNANYGTEFSEAQVVVAPKRATITAQGASKAYGAKDPELTATLEGLIDGESLDYSLSRVKGEDVGSYAVSVALGANPNYAIETVPANLTITPASINGVALALSQESFTYNGSVQKPTVRTIGGKTLKLNTDYTLKYSNASSKVKGSYQVWVEGKGNYKGTSAKARYTIAAKSLSKATVTGVKAKTYTGKGLTQTPTVKLGSTTLKKNVDYTLSYKNNIDVGSGTASVIIEGAGNYAGSLTKKFSIVKAANPMSVAAKKPAVGYSKTKARTVKGTAAFSFKKKAVGVVTYTRVAKGSSKWLSKVNAKNGAITVKAGAPKGTYKVNVKVTAKGNAGYKSAVKTITVSVKVK